MATLAPTADSQVYLASPIEQANPLGAVADLAAAFAKTRKEPKEVSQGNQKAKDLKSFYQTMREADVLKANGRDDAASRLKDKALLTWSGSYGSDEDVESFWTNSTGKSATLTTTGSLHDLGKLASSEEFQGNLALTGMRYPDMAPEEQHQLALRTTLDDRGNATLVKQYATQKEVDWTKAEGTYVSIAKSAASKLTLMLESGNEDGIITSKESEAIRKYYASITRDLQNPGSVPNEKWESFKKNHVDSIDDIFETAMGVIASDETALTHDLKRSLASMLDKAVIQGKLRPSIRTHLNGLQGDWKSIIDILKQNDGTSILDNERDLLGMNYEEMLAFVTEFEHQTSLESVMKKASQEFKDWEETTGGVKKEGIEADISLLGLHSDPGKQSLVMANLLTKMESLGSQTVTPDMYGQIFSPSFFKALKTIDAKNSVVGEELVQKASEALSTHANLISKELESLMVQHGLGRNEAGQIVAVNDELIKSQFKNAAGRPFSQAIVDEQFGGSWARAFNESQTGIMKMNRQKLVAQVQKPMDRMVAAQKAIKTLTKTFVPQHEASLAVPEVPPQNLGASPEGVEGAEGAGGGSSSVEGNPAVAQMTSLLDTHEGAGNYDTLYGHSQKSGKAFSGIRVTGMTVAEALAFAKGRGAGSYAQWVKANNLVNGKNVLSSPMGRYQIIGSTLQGLIKEMGLTGNELFDEPMQDAMFYTLAQRRVREAKSNGGSREAYLRAFRNEWDGFKHVGDKPLWAAIKAMQAGGNAAGLISTFSTRGDGDPGGFTGGSGVVNGGAGSITPEPIDVSVLPGDSGPAAFSGGGSVEGAGGGDASADLSPASADGGPSGEEGETASEKVTQELTERTKAMLKRNNIDPDVVIQFTSEEEYQEALRLGNVKEGDYVSIKQEVFQV